jgi:hypothetical protein
MNEKFTWYVRTKILVLGILTQIFCKIVSHKNGRPLFKTFVTGKYLIRNLGFSGVYTIACVICISIQFFSIDYRY